MGDPHSDATPLEWGSDLGDPVALLSVEPEEVDPAAGLKFVMGHDDLDAVWVATCRAASGRDYTLVLHANSPVPGTEILTTMPLSQVAAIVKDVRQILASLSLDEGVITWLAPAIASALERTAAE